MVCIFSFVISIVYLINWIYKFVEDKDIIENYNLNFELKVDKDSLK